MVLSTALMLSGLAASGLVSGLSQYKAAQQNSKAREEEAKAYRRNRLALEADLYRSPFDSYANKLLLKSLDREVRDINDAADNRAAAAGATVENRLAARESTNQMVSNTYDRALLGEDARQQHIRNQQLALENQHSQNVANNYAQDAQNWQQWGAQTSQALGQFATSAMLGGFGGSDPLLHYQAEQARAATPIAAITPPSALTPTAPAQALTQSGLLPRKR